MRRLLALPLLLGIACAQQDPGPLKVFLLAGQSNMEGQAVIDLDHPQHYNGGKGTLVHLMKDARHAERFAHLRGPDGNWTSRDDVQVWYRNHHGNLKRGPLSIGFAVYPGRHHFGPELQFGHIVGNFLSDPVLLIKTCWGGKSLYKDFRPPSAGGTVGPYYTKMLSEVREVLRDLGKHFPKHAKQKTEFAGMVWFQGWNDMYDDEAIATYPDTLAHLVGDVRKELKAPNLPVVVAETGNGKKVFRAAQAKILDRKVPHLAFVQTAAFGRPAKDSPNVGHGHHWFGNAESYLLIGDTMGKAMVKLLSGKSRR